MDRAGPRPVRCGLYVDCCALPMRRPTCFDGPARAAAHDMCCTTAAARMSAHVDLLFVALVQMPDDGFDAAVGGPERGH